MNISSAVVRARPEKLAQVQSRLEGMPGVEIHAATTDGKIVVTVEDNSAGAAADTFVRLHDIEGVVSVSLVYQYSDDGSQLEETQQ